jgi:putative FmdB family regulatory protein
MTVIVSNMRLQFLVMRIPGTDSVLQRRPPRARRWVLGRINQVPIYDYVCMTCESHFEELVGMSDPDPTCPDCGNAKVVKQFNTSFAAHGTAGQSSSGGGCCGGGCGCC